MIPIMIPKDPQHASGHCTCSGKLMVAKTKMKHHAFLDVYMWLNNKCVKHTWICLGVCMTVSDMFRTKIHVTDPMYRVPPNY